MNPRNRVGRTIAYGLGIGLAAPKTLSFAAQAALGRHEVATRLSPSLIAQVALDEVILAAMKTPGRFPHRADYEHASEDILAAHQWFGDHGYLDDPRRYHRDPQPPADAVIEPAWWMGSGWDHVWYESAFEPDVRPSTQERWLSNEPNRTMRAFIRRTDDVSGPWVVFVHPFATGQGVLGNLMFRAAATGDELGANVAMVVLPRHGSRGGGLIAGGSAFMNYNPVDMLLGITQSVWDVRRFVKWLSAEGAGPVALHGVSLGAHVSSIVAGLEKGLAGVVAGVPTVDLLDVFVRHIPPRLYPRAVEHDLVGPQARAVCEAVSPLTFPPLLPSERLSIFAATGDRMAPPDQAMRLHAHWGEPDLRWFDANHMAFIWHGGISAFVREGLRTALDDAA